MQPVTFTLPNGERRLRPVRGEKKSEPDLRNPLRELQDWALRKLRPRLLQCTPPVGHLRRQRDAELRRKARRKFRAKRREFYGRDEYGRQVALPPCPISPLKE